VPHSWVQVDLDLIAISESRDRLVDRSDVARVMTSKQWCRRTEDGLWTAVAPAVWCHRATPIDWRLQARAGLRSLGRPSALHGCTAAAWWRLGEIEVEEPEFVVPRHRKGRPFPFVLHTTQHWDNSDLLVHDGLRLTSATRTIVDLAVSGSSARDIEAVIDDAIKRRMTSLPTLRRRTDDLCGKGVQGSSLLKALVLDSGGESYLERRFLALVRRAGLPRPTCQVVHRADGKRIARVDFQFPRTNVIVEVSGRLGHVSDTDRQRDARRRNALQQTGHVVLEFTTADVLDAQAYIVATLREQLRLAVQR
jgi:Protein of unknown function (DUF559)